MWGRRKRMRKLAVIRLTMRTTGLMLEPCPRQQWDLRRCLYCTEAMVARNAKELYKADFCPWRFRRINLNHLLSLWKLEP